MNGYKPITLDDTNRPPTEQLDATGRTAKSQPNPDANKPDANRTNGKILHVRAVQYMFMHSQPNRKSPPKPSASLHKG